jgi:hypothetical protein
MNTSDARAGRSPSEIARQLAPAALLLVAALACLLAQRAQRDPTTPQDWAKAAAMVVKEAASADAIRTEPPWREDALVPLAPLQARFQRVDEVWSEDLFGVDGLWIVSEQARVQRALDRLPFEAAPDKTQSFGSVVALHVPVPATPRYTARLSDMLNTAQVAIVEGEAARPCRWDAPQERWACIGAGANIEVRPRTMEMQDAPRRCIWAPPPGDGKLLRVTFPAVALGQTLRLRAGMDLFGARREGVDITWRARIGDAQIAGATVREHQDGWPATDVDTSRWAGKPAALTVEVDATSWERRHLCFEGWIR